MRIKCSQNPDVVKLRDGITFSMYHRPNNLGVGRIACTMPMEVRRSGIKANVCSWDFLSLALSVIAADLYCMRDKSSDGWTRVISLEVEVIDSRFWNTQKNAMEKALSFLTGDIWSIVFSGNICRSTIPVPTKRTKRVVEGDCVCLFSGGADSLVGAIDLVATGNKPVFVSQVAQGDKTKQSDFSKAIDVSLSHLQLTHAVDANGPSERSQRARSILFLAYGLLAASYLSDLDNRRKVKLIVPENGFISINVPLTPLRLGSLSTKTTHPYFIRQIQNIWNASGFSVEIVNPYQFKTKGEMFTECKNQELLKQLAFQSTSCSRFGRYNFCHCGRCVPCIVRRAAFHKWNYPDKTSYRFEDISIQNSDHLNFDDIKSMLYAIHTVETKGLDYWIGNAISSAYFDIPDEFIDIAHRGLNEVKAFFQSVHIL